ncbi:RNA repair transcriptional activator RtcR family protein [Pseudomonadota bacterium]
MKSILISWVGNADIQAASLAGTEKYGAGPVVQALVSGEYDYVRLLLNYEDANAATLKSWFKKHTTAEIDLLRVKLGDPTDFDAIYKAAIENIEACRDKDLNARLTIHLSPGTPAMQSVWILLAKTRFDAILIQSSREHGVKLASIPFDISAEYIPDLMRARGERLAEKLGEKPLTSEGFESITYRSPIMKRLVERARKVALHSVPVLIEGESGTGKELLARSIHAASSRSDYQFVAINCGSMPANLVESQLFGHKKGAFTDAVADHKGFFETASGGTIFLDEVGELELAIQVKLLRVLQEKEFIPLGANNPIKSNVRIISATNRSLITEVGKGSFREDLFFRLAVATLNLPPLRQREGDLKLMIDTLTKSVQSDMLELDEKHHKSFSAKAKNVFLNHDWPGNVRELQNTIARAVLWSDGTNIGEDDARDAILVANKGSAQDLMTLPLDDGFNLQELLERIEQHYIQRALSESHWKKAVASRKLGMKNYQNLSNKMAKYRLE